MTAADVLFERVELNGVAATAADLRALLFNYGHFTSMQVREGRVRGLDLHLGRLDRASIELFAHSLDIEATRGHLRTILAGETRALSLRVNVFSRALQRDRLDAPAPPDVLVSLSAPRHPATAPVRVMSVRHERQLPHIKHVGTFDLFRQRRLAQAAGFDDALFVDARGEISEGSIWNVGFLDGARVVWPGAPALDGIAMQLLKRGLRALGVESVTRSVRLDEIGRFDGAFFTNSSCAVLPIAGIDEIAYAVDAKAVEMLEACMALAPWQPI